MPPSGAVLIVPAGPTVPFASSDGLFAVHVPQVVDHILMLSASADVLISVRAAMETALITLRRSEHFITHLDRVQLQITSPTIVSPIALIAARANAGVFFQLLPFTGHRMDSNTDQSIPRSTGTPVRPPLGLDA